MPKAPFISLTVWGYFTNTPWWGVSEIGLAPMAYVFAVEGSSGFHTLYSQFSHAYGGHVPTTKCSDKIHL